MLSSGEQNVFIGDRAGYTAGGDENVFIGATAGYGCSTGCSRNIAIGLTTFSNNTSGSDNIAL